VKKLLAILIIAGLYLAILPGQQIQSVVSGIKSVEKNQSISSLTGQPYSPFEISQLAVATGNNCRQQNPDISINSRAVVEFTSRHFARPGCETTYGLATKNYLCHNYPSHNFW